MPDSTDSVKQHPSWMQRLKQWLVPAMILLMAAGIVFLIAGNWNTWASERAAQETDDAYLRADLTPLSTKVAGLVATVAVSDYQSVKSGDLLVQLRDDDFRAQVQQAEAAVARRSKMRSSTISVKKNCRTPASYRRTQGIRAAEADITAAEAGIEAAKSTIANARSGIDGDQSGRGAHVIGAPAAGSADRDGIRNAAEAGAGSGGRAALSRTTRKPRG